MHKRHSLLLSRYGVVKKRYHYFFLIFFLASLSIAVADTSLGIEKPALFKSSDLIHPQEKGKIYPQVLKNKNNQPVSVIVSLAKQKVYLCIGGYIAIESPISSGRKSTWTPKGNFLISEKDPNHRSNVYGNFVDSGGNIIKAGIDRRVDSAPSGTHYVGAPMLYFMRLGNTAVGMHIGMLPGYPASHGCVRLPFDMAPTIYDAVVLGTPVTVQD
ncbi:MAG: L,D-transpeptidase family protein [Chthoniobacterales bacterium]